MRITLAVWTTLVAIAAHGSSQYCELSCLSGDSCTLGGRPLPAVAAEISMDCTDVRGVVGGHIGLWQFESNDQVFREVVQGEEIGNVLARADRTGLEDLLRKRERASGGSPFDGDSDDGTGSTGAGIGLPFGIVLPPHRPAVLVDVTAADANGRLTVFDSATKRQVARLTVRNRRVPFDKLSLRANAIYNYTYTTGANARYEGRFKTASGATAADVQEDTEYTLRKKGIPTGQHAMVRAKVLTEYDLRWDAYQILVSGGEQ